MGRSLVQAELHRPFTCTMRTIVRSNANMTVQLAARVGQRPDRHALISRPRRSARWDAGGTKVGGSAVVLGATNISTSMAQRRFHW